MQQAVDEEKGPKLVFSDGTESIFLADLSGDGLTDLARIRNGEVCYWPNLGYGRFGAKVTMDRAPWFEAPDLFAKVTREDVQRVARKYFTEKNRTVGTLVPLKGDK